MATMDQILADIRANESSGNYSLAPWQNSDYPNSHASGAYQFQPSTWQQLTQQSGIGTQYAEAYQAPPAVQDQVAAYAVQNGNPNSSNLWGASANKEPGGAYPSLDSNSQIAQGPNLSNYPDAGSAGSGTTAGSMGAPSILDQLMGVQNPLQLDTSGATAAATSGTGWPLAIGLLPGVGQAVSDWIASIENAVGQQVQNTFGYIQGIFIDLFERGFLIIIGLLIVIVALWRLMDPQGTATKTVVTTAARAAA